MTNLLTNACKFTSEGFVQLTVSRVDKVDIPENAIVPAPALDIPLPTADDQDTVKLLFKVRDKKDASFATVLCVKVIEKHQTLDRFSELLMYSRIPSF